MFRDLATATPVGMALTLLLVGGCDDPVQVGRTNPTPGGGDPLAEVDAGAELAGELDAGGGPNFDDDDFVEADIVNRDPFRNFVQSFKVRPLAVPQRRVIMSTTGIEEMRLIAIISGVAQPRAMLVDADGVGHVVARGDYIGRPEVVQAGGADGMPVTLNWRVDRIRDSEIVLTRRDPLDDQRPPLTRRIPLHEDEEEQGASSSPQG